LKRKSTKVLRSSFGAPGLAKKATMGGKLKLPDINYSNN